MASSCPRALPTDPPSWQRLSPTTRSASSSSGGAGMPWGWPPAGAFTSSKVGTRHVQSRTAAGGWSQQRFARRRGKQADELVDAVVGHARRILLGDDESPREGAPGIPDGLVVGGDRTLVREVLAASALRALRGLPTRELYDLPDPEARRARDCAAARPGRARRAHRGPRDGIIER